MKAHAIIFDLDGTIIDTESLWAEATKQMLEERGYDYDERLKETIHKNVHGLPPIQACTRLKTMMQLPDDPYDLACEKSQRAHQLISGQIKFIPGFVDFHTKVQKHIDKLAIATNCSNTFVTLANKEIKLYNFFGEHIYHMGHVNNQSKPKPDIYLYAAQQLSVEPYLCIAIEDSAPGIAAAKNAGMFCIGINTSGYPEKLKEADYLVNTYDEIDLEHIF